MAEYIDKNATVGILEAMSRSTDCECIKKRLEKAAKRISAIPAADVAPVVHARWMHSRYEDCSEQFELVKCSQCNHEAYAMAFYVRGGNYCPACGAKMDGGDNDAVG